MERDSGDASEYRFFTSPGASIDCRFIALQATPEIQIFGNRAGLLSLANIFLWFLANAWRREFFSFGELGFVHLEGSLSISMRLVIDPQQGHGIVRQMDHGDSLEWMICEDGLRQVALWIHSLASKPSHEYDRLLTAPESFCGIHVRMTDVSEWLARGIA